MLYSDTGHFLSLRMFHNLSFESAHDKTYKMACVHCKDSDQCGHLPSLIRVFAVCSMDSEDPSFLQTVLRTGKTDQTGQMPRLI